MELIKKIYKNDSLHIYTCKMKLSGEEEKMYFSAVNMGYGSIKYINTDNKESAISFLAAVVEHGMAVIVDDIPKFQCRKDSSKLLDCTDNEYVVPSTTSYYVAMKLFGFINYQVFDIKEIIDIDDMYKQHYSLGVISFENVVKLFKICKEARKNGFKLAKYFAIDLDTYNSNLAEIMGYDGIYYNQVAQFYEVKTKGLGVEVRDKSLDGYIDVAKFFGKMGYETSITNNGDEFVIRVSK